MDARWQMVTCRGCGRRYRCTPDEDYYESTTLEDGLCWDCLLAQEAPDMEGTPEPPAPAPDSWGDALARAQNMPPEGGRIELPDGWAIEIRPAE
jgi:hypothetical protein